MDLEIGSFFDLHIASAPLTASIVVACVIVLLICATQVWCTYWRLA